MKPPIITTRDPQLSLWQSLAESRQQFKNKDLSISEIRNLPFMQGVYAHVLETQGKEIRDLPVEIAEHAAKSKYFYELAIQQPQILVLETAETRNYSDADSQWVLLALTWGTQASIRYSKTLPWYEQLAEFLLESVGTLTFGFAGYIITVGAKEAQWLLQSSDTKIQQKLIEYRKWHDNSKGKNYSLIDWKLPNDAKVVMLGDWGTSNPDCKALLKAIWQQESPDAFVHLGDIYYSGTKTECDNNFYNIFAHVAAELGKPMVPVFTIPGNHEYYSFGEGYFHLIDKMNKNINNHSTQNASYFCLRTADNKWQFLGMDTGQDDNNPYVTALYPFAPKLFDDKENNSELEWHQDKLSNFSGQTILMSHHQLFTRDAANKIDSNVEPYFNRFLQEYFSPFYDKIAAWYWGHEHSFALYEDGIFGLAKGRLMGCSSYEVPNNKGYYDLDYPMVPYSTNSVAPPVDNDGFYHHVCAVFRFARTNANDPIQVDYYSFPSWGQNQTNPNARLSLLCSEPIAPSTMPSLRWEGNNKVTHDPDYKIQSANTPSIFENGNIIYMAYNNSSDNKIKKTSYHMSNDDNEWDEPKSITVDGKNVYTNHGVSLTSNELIFHIFYADRDHNDEVGLLIDEDQYSTSFKSPIFLERGGKRLQSGSKISAAWINNDCYFCFKDKNSNTNILGYIDSNKNMHYFDSSLFPSNITNPTLVASGNVLHYFFANAQSPAYIHWYFYDTITRVWQHSYVNNGDILKTVGTPQSSRSLSAVVEPNGDITLFYDGKEEKGKHTLNWTTYSNKTKKWSGGVSVPRMGEDKDVPFMHEGAAATLLSKGGIYVVFTGKSDNSVRYISRN